MPSIWGKPMPIPAISVIIPIYNTGPWLRRCLESICCQTLKHIEIICINDGSTDESGAIISEYADRDSRVHHVTFGKNQGVGIARNIGLVVARGEWLGFVDSDDSLAPDFYEKLYIAAKTNDAELVKGTSWIESKSLNRIDPNFNAQIHHDKYKFSHGWTTAIYNSKFIFSHNIRFPHLTNCEDLVFLYNAVSKAKKVTIVNDALYYCFYREGSSSTSVLTRRMVDSVITARKMMIGILNSNDTININKYISEYAKMMFSFYFFLENGAKITDYDYALKETVSAIYDSYRRCHSPDLLIKEASKYDSCFGSFISNGDEDSLKKFLSTSRLQRVRTRVQKSLCDNTVTTFS